MPAAVWDGKLVFKSLNGKFKASDTSDELLMVGNPLCNAYVVPGVVTYQLSIWRDAGMLWEGENGVNNTPLGTYIRTDGSLLVPASVVIVAIADPEQATDESQPCLPI